MKDLPNTDAYSFRFQEKQSLSKLPGTITGHNFALEELTKCEVSLLDFMSTLTIIGCTNCTIRSGPCSGLVQIQHCTGCMLSVAGTAFSISSSDDMIIFLFSASEPVVKQCTRVSFAPYNLAYAGLSDHFRSADLEPRKNLWSRVRCDDPKGFGVCWGLVQKHEYIPIEIDIEGEGSPENPVPLPEAYGGSHKGQLVVGSQEVAMRLEEDSDEPEIIYPPVYPGVFSNPQLSAAQDSKVDFIPPPADRASLSSTRSVVIYYDQGFDHAAKDPVLATYPLPQSTLKELSALALPHYQYISTLVLCAYFLVLSGLLLYLIVILLDQFVGLHPAGLALLLFFLTVCLGVVGTIIGLKWRGVVKTCTADMATYTTARQSEYLGMKVEVQATMGQVMLKAV